MNATVGTIIARSKQNAPTMMGPFLATATKGFSEMAMNVQTLMSVHKKAILYDVTLMQIVLIILDLSGMAKYRLLYLK